MSQVKYTPPAPKALYEGSLPVGYKFTVWGYDANMMAEAYQDGYYVGRDDRSKDIYGKDKLLIELQNRLEEAKKDLKHANEVTDHASREATKWYHTCNELRGQVKTMSTTTQQLEEAQAENAQLTSAIKVLRETFKDVIQEDADTIKALVQERDHYFHKSFDAYAELDAAEEALDEFAKEFTDEGDNDGFDSVAEYVMSLHLSHKVKTHKMEALIDCQNSCIMSAKRVNKECRKIVGVGECESLIDALHTLVAASKKT